MRGEEVLCDLLPVSPRKQSPKLRGKPVLKKNELNKIALLKIRDGSKSRLPVVFKELSAYLSAVKAPVGVNPRRGPLVIFRVSAPGEFPKQNQKNSSSSSWNGHADINHIVLAEDDSDDSDFFRSALSFISSPISLTVTEHGKGLMKILETARYLPDFVFLDLNMPVMNGYECMRAIRANSKFDDLKVIVLSTSGEASTVDELYKLGATAFIVKPTDVGLWAALVAKALSTISSATRPLREKFLITV